MIFNTPTSYESPHTNISYAHIKNFNSIKGIAEAKAEIIKNITSGGRIILNADDVFYNFFKERALNRGLKIISFSIKNKSDFQFIDNKKNRIKKIVEIKSNNKKYKFKVLYLRINKYNIIHQLKRHIPC